MRQRCPLLRVASGRSVRCARDSTDVLEVLGIKPQFGEGVTCGGERRENVNGQTKSIRAQAAPLIHMDIAVTSDRLEEFAQASCETQRATLAALRERAANDGETELSVVGVAVAILIALFVPTDKLVDFSTATAPFELVGRVAGIALVSF